MKYCEQTITDRQKKSGTNILMIPISRLHTSKFSHQSGKMKPQVLRNCTFIFFKRFGILNICRFNHNSIPFRLPNFFLHHIVCVLHFPSVFIRVKSMEGRLARCPSVLGNILKSQAKILTEAVGQRECLLPKWWSQLCPLCPHPSRSMTSKALLPTWRYKQRSF